MKSAERIGDVGKSDEMTNEIDALKGSLTQLRGDVVDLVSHAFGIGRGGAASAKESAGDAIEQLKARLSDLRSRGGEQVAAVERQIEEKPMQAAMVAFGIGFIAAMLFSRR
jgi:ElaB/YqjD/DUF883 family membrane-anchored ribosome-binding protein